MRIEFSNIDFQFENFGVDERRGARIASMALTLLNIKMQAEPESLYENQNYIMAEESLIVPKITISSELSDHEIASRCASAMHQTIIDKLLR